jgi:kexin
LAEGTRTGRGGLGTLFVFAAGNGRAFGDDANYDGYANSLSALAVGAVTDQGTQASYSEPGACLTVVAPSGSAGRPRLVTTDLAGLDGAESGDYTTNFTGTSASAPLVSGVIALILEANPRLGWRDVREILMRSARPNDTADRDWATNQAGLPFNHKYGAGLINASGAVALAPNWVNLGPPVVVSLEQTDLFLSVPDNQPAGVDISFIVTNRNFRVEQLALRVQLEHDDWGDLELSVRAPSGMTSVLAQPHSPAFDQKVDWTFTSVRHWGESAFGTWTVNIADRRFLNTGKVQGLRLEIHGSTAATLAPSLSIHWRDEGIELLIKGEAGAQYMLESSSTPFDWQPLATLQAPDGRATYRDNRALSTVQFYRVWSVSALR